MKDKMRPPSAVNATIPRAYALRDDELWELAAWINVRRTEVRQEITKRSGLEVTVFIDWPPMEFLSDVEVSQLKKKAEALAADCQALLVQRAGS